MKTLATSTAAIALALSLSGSALANATRADSSAKRAKHHLRHHRPTHKHTGIGPGGDEDSDNHGAPSDGDGNFYARRRGGLVSAPPSIPCQSSGTAATSNGCATSSTSPVKVGRQLAACVDVVERELTAGKVFGPQFGPVARLYAPGPDGDSDPRRRRARPCPYSNSSESESSYRIGARQLREGCAVHRKADDSRPMDTFPAPTTSPESPQRWEIDLLDLQKIGWTAAAAADWAYRSLTPAQIVVLEGLWAFWDEQATVWGADSRRALTDLGAFFRGAPGRRANLEVVSVGLGAMRSVEFHVHSSGRDPLPGSDVTPLRWRVRMGRIVGDEPFVEFLVDHDVGGRRLSVRVHRRNRERDWRYNWGSFPWHVKMARGARAFERRRLQVHDASELEPIVVINGRWLAGRLAESVMAQLVEWHYRVEGRLASNARNVPVPTADVLAWWVGWVQRVARDSENAGLPEAIALARRSVRPAHPSGHQMYWRQSLRFRPPSRVQQACDIAGIARSTGYQRLQRSHRRANEFTSVNDLADFLRRAAPRRSLPPERRELIDALIEAGMQPAAARKFERRLRDLPPEEQHLRARRKVAILGGAAKPHRSADGKAKKAARDVVRARAVVSRDGLLLDAISFREVVPCAEKLDVLRDEG